MADLKAAGLNPHLAAGSAAGAGAGAAGRALHPRPAEDRLVGAGVPLLGRGAHLRVLLGDVELLRAGEVGVFRAVGPTLPDMGDAACRLCGVPAFRRRVRRRHGVDIAESRRATAVGRRPLTSPVRFFI